MNLYIKELNYYSIQIYEMQRDSVKGGDIEAWLAQEMLLTQ